MNKDKIIEEIDSIDIHITFRHGSINSLVSVLVDDEDLGILKEFLESLLETRDSRLFNQSMPNIMRKL